MTEILDDIELRHLVVGILQKPSERTLQTRIGASDLADNCDRCLAFKMKGIDRRSPQADRPWFGAEWGTAGHLLMQSRIEEILAAIEDESLTPAEREQAQRLATTVFGLPAGTRAERRLKVAFIPGYGWVYGTIDLDLPGQIGALGLHLLLNAEGKLPLRAFLPVFWTSWAIGLVLPGQIGDYKGSTRKKAALLQDFLAIARGEEQRRWVKQKDTKAYEGGYKLNMGSDAVVSLSKKKYDEEMDKAVYKMNGYFDQQTIYMHGRALEGRPVTRGSIIWLNRDGNGYFDEPSAARYDDPTAHHDVWILSFDYNAQHAQSIIDRAARIWAQLEANIPFAEFDQSPACYVCSFEEKEKLRLSEVPDIEVAYGEVAA